MKPGSMTKRIWILIARKLSDEASEQDIKELAKLQNEHPEINYLSITLITLLTISFQAIKAAIANPVKSLRTE